MSFRSDSSCIQLLDVSLVFFNRRQGLLVSIGNGEFRKLLGDGQAGGFECWIKAARPGAAISAVFSERRRPCRSIDSFMTTSRIISGEVLNALFDARPLFLAGPWAR